MPQPEPTPALTPDDITLLKLCFVDAADTVEKLLIVEPLPGTPLSPAARAAITSIARRILRTRLDSADVDAYVARQKNIRLTELLVLISDLQAEHDALASG